MASIIGAALAFAIAGTAVNYGAKALFGGSDMERHNREMEKISRERMKHDFERQEKYDMEHKRDVGIKESDYGINKTNKDIDRYYAYNRPVYLKSLHDKTSDNTHTPKDTMIIVGVAVSGVILYIIYENETKHKKHK